MANRVVSKKHTGWRWDEANVRLDCYTEGVKVFTCDSTGTSAKWGVHGKVAAQQATIATLAATVSGYATVNSIITALENLGLLATV